MATTRPAACSLKCTLELARIAGAVDIPGSRCATRSVIDMLLACADRLARRLLSERT